MQNLLLQRPGYPEWLDKKRAEHSVFISFALQVARKQKRAGRHYLGENPLSSRAWLTKPGKALMGESEVVRTHMCAWNLKCTETGLGVRKPTRLVVSNKQVAIDMGKLCTRQHDHRPISGTWRVNGKRMSASVYAGGYTEGFCVGILESFERAINAEMFETYVITGFENDVRAQGRRALLDDVPLDIHKARRRALLDDVPHSVRR